MAFKPNVDDLRESPALEIVSKLIENKKQVMICEPHLDNYELPLYSLEKVIDSGDLLIFLVAHDQFKELDIRDKKLRDFCGVFQ